MLGTAQVKESRKRLAHKWDTELLLRQTKMNFLTSDANKQLNSSRSPPDLYIGQTKLKLR